MDSNFQCFWPAICGGPGAYFAGDTRLLAAELWHARPKTSVYRFRVANKRVAYYFKIYKREAEYAIAKVEHDTLTALGKLFDDAPGLGVVHPVAYVRELHGFVSEEFVGTDLSSFFRAAVRRGASAGKMRDGVRVAHRLAVWLQIFQRGEPPSAGEPYDLSRMHSTARRDLQTALASKMVTARTAERVREALDDSRAKLEGRATTLVPANVDAKLWNFLLGPSGEIRALDFVGIGTGLPTLDVARLWVGLNWLKVFPHHSRRRVSRLQQEFLRALSPIPDPTELHFHQLCVMTEIAAFYAGIRSDRYRRKFRNIALFPLIQRYFDRSLRALTESHGGGGQS